MATLDVLIPHYNDPEGFRRSLDTVAAQTWTGDLRAVVVDDGSGEAERAKLERILQDAPFPVSLSVNERNLGRPRTRNRLLDRVEAPYVAWLDAGDLWLPRKLELQFEHLSRLRLEGEPAEARWITCNYHWRWEGGRLQHRTQEVNQDQLKALLMGKSLRGYLWTVLAPASAFERVGRFDEDLPRLQDLDYFIRFVKAGGRLTRPPVRQALCVYEKSDIGRNAREIRACNDRVFDKHRDAFDRHGRKFVRMRRFEAELHSARFAANNRNRGLLGLYLLRAFRAHPTLFLEKTLTGRLSL